MNIPKPPYLGAAYYPEAWDDDEILYDVKMMREAGLSVVRIAEFAWHKMEPRSGEFDFAWLHRVVDILRENGIAVILGTPTATPPIWLSQQYPDIFKEQEDGTRAVHGGRRSCCSNHPRYREYSARIVEKMAAEFAGDVNVIGWQIDNEIYASKPCFCPLCQTKFREYLREKYGTAEQLNRCWDLEVFSQAYSSFEEIPPARRAWHNPHLRQAWAMFAQDCHIDFVHMQADILHRYVHVPVGTDVMTLNGMNYSKLNEKLDVVQFNHYHEPKDLWDASFWFSFYRTFKERPFWNTETATCWNGSYKLKQSIKPDGFCVLNSFMPLAYGGEANLYWLWRTHWGGQELMHGSVLDSSGRPMHIFGEVKESARLIQKAADFLGSTRVSSEIGFHYTSLNWNLLSVQATVPEVGPTVPQERFYKPLAELGLQTDVLEADRDLSPYKLLISPLCLSLDECGLPERIAEWVRQGGVWIAGPLTDVRTADGTHFPHRPFGFLEELTGAKWLYGLPDHEQAISCAWKDGEGAFRGEGYYQLFEDSGHSLVRVTGGHRAILGTSVLGDYPVGKGHVLLLGTLPDSDSLKTIYGYAAMLAGIRLPETEGFLLTVNRAGGGRSGRILMEVSGRQSAAYRFEGKKKELLSGREAEGSLELPPYGIAILED